MDPISQGLLGASAAQLTSQTKLPRTAWLIGFLAGMAADLDILIYSPFNPMLFMVYHRHFTHSFFFIPLGGALVAAALCAIIPSYKPHWRAVLVASIAGYATHGFIDVCTSYGTLYFWPLTSHRYSLDWISIVDPVFTVTLFLGVLWGYLRQSRLIVFIMLLLALGYLGIGGIQHERALLAQEKITHSRMHPIKQHRVMPTFANLFNWRSVYASGGTIYVDLIHVPFFAKATHYPIAKVKRFADSKQIASQQWRKDIDTFKWFTDDLVGVFEESPLTLADMRYLVKTHPPTSLWGIVLPEDEKQKHVDLKRRLVLKAI